MFPIVRAHVMLIERQLGIVPHLTREDASTVATKRDGDQPPQA